MSWISVSDFQHPTGWTNTGNREEHAKRYCQQLEDGQILFFREIPFELPDKHREFLLSQRPGDSRYHKNVSYRPQQDVLRGFASRAPNDSTQLHEIMRAYSTQVTQFLTRFLSPYAKHWSLDFASFRPLEEEGRDLPLHQRNDLLHVDAFPSRPTRGGRILRVFTNLHPSQPRIWHTTDCFDILAQRFAFDAGLHRLAARASSPVRRFRRSVIRALRAMGMPVVDRSPYDTFMLRFHDYLKEHTHFQKECAKVRLEFPPGATWIVFTDAVAHAALSGQYALEHTYIVPPDALLAPHKAPIRVLEALCGRSLAA